MIPGWRRRYSNYFRALKQRHWIFAFLFPCPRTYAPKNHFRSRGISSILSPRFFLKKGNMSMQQELAKLPNKVMHRTPIPEKKLLITIHKFSWISQKTLLLWERPALLWHKRRRWVWQMKRGGENEGCGQTMASTVAASVLSPYNHACGEKYDALPTRHFPKENRKAIVFGTSRKGQHCLSLK